MTVTRTLERKANALPDDPEWCGHPMVDLSAWRCADCGRPVCLALRRRMQSAPTAAPPGAVWVLTEGPGGDYDEDYAGGSVVGVFSDRARIGQLLVRHQIIGAASLRERLSRITWYQGAINPQCFEGRGTKKDGRDVNYRLDLEQIDRL